MVSFRKREAVPTWLLLQYRLILRIIAVTVVRGHGINFYFSNYNVEIILKVIRIIQNKVLLYTFLPDSPVVNCFRKLILKTIVLPDAGSIFHFHQLSQ